MQKEKERLRDFTMRTDICTSGYLFNRRVEIGLTLVVIIYFDSIRNRRNLLKFTSYVFPETYESN